MELISEAKKSMGTKTKLTETQKRNLSEDAKSLVEAGWYSAGLELTNASHFVDFLKDKFEADYAKQARTELAEADKAETIEYEKKNNMSSL